MYFHGNGISLALTVLLIYAVVAATALGFLDWFRSPEIPITPETEVDAAAMTAPVGAAP